MGIKRPERPGAHLRADSNLARTRKPERGRPDHPYMRAEPQRRETRVLAHNN